jgi:FkbM family methyltransferase
MKPGDIANYLATPNEAELELTNLFTTDQAITIFDIGACEGEESIRYIRRFSNAQVFAFEPLPENQQLMRDNFRRYSVTNAEIIPVALSDRAGEAMFHVSSGRPEKEFAGGNWNYGNKSSSLLAPVTDAPMYGWIEFPETITVPCTTLDAFCDQRDIQSVDFIHMDVQGAEHLVLAGADRILRKTTSLWLEVSDQRLYRGQKLRSEMEALLAAKGFSLRLEVRREVEGDQFYVNRKLPQTWRYLACKQLVSAVRSIKKRLRTGKS